MKLFVFSILTVTLLLTTSCGKKSGSNSTKNADPVTIPEKNQPPVLQENSSLKQFKRELEPVVNIPLEASKDYSASNKPREFTPVPPSKDLSALFGAIPEGAEYEEPKGAGGISQQQDMQNEEIPAQTTPQPTPRLTPNPMPAPPPPPAPSPVLRPTPSVKPPVVTNPPVKPVTPPPRVVTRPELPSVPVTSQGNKGLFPDTSWRKIWVKVFPMTSNDRSAYETNYPQTKNKDSAVLKNSTQLYVIHLQTGRLVAKANSISFLGGGVKLDQSEYKASDLYVINYSDNATQICWDGNRCYNYRGHFVVKYVGSSPIIINVADLEKEYLAGVVPIEMSPSWPVEALKAQAISARTYALFEMIAARKARDSGKWLYDILPTTNDQAYMGSKYESASVN